MTSRLEFSIAAKTKAYAELTQLSELEALNKALDIALSNHKLQLRLKTLSTIITNAHNYINNEKFFRRFIK